MIYGSVCSGIEAATVAWEPLGWKPAFFSEIEKFPREVLKHHYPNVPLHGDFTTIGANEYGAINLLVGGTPCQSFSIAGLRKGLSDERGNLALEYIRLAQRKSPKWLVWENVPGVLSSNGGRDFGCFLGALAKCGYGFAYRVLDAQYFGVPQQRRRVFVVGCFGNWRPAAAVLFERDSLFGDIKTRPKKKNEVARTLRSGAINGGKGHGARSGYCKDSHIIPVYSSKLSKTIMARDGMGGFDLERQTPVCDLKGVRRLTPREYERLQGFPDDYTLIKIKGKNSSDRARYKALGNSMAVPVMRWIGQRIKLVTEILNNEE